jgi:16S rRNA (adenine1518-N6/adenine1519-N6)-dimethyltransferase
MYALLKKKYGQNFLIDKNIVKKITQLIPNQKLDIMEIGPGDGKLTDEILTQNPLHLTLIEIDKDLIESLNLKYNKFEQIKIINEDILKYQINKKYDLAISNLPYNISSQILVKLTILDKAPKKMIFMFQKEFAQRLLDVKLNSLNSLISCFYEIDLNFHVSRNCFRPIPKIDSSVVSFNRKNDPLINKDEIENFINLKRRLFSHKRKSLKNLLKDYKIDNKFDLSMRIEDLDLKNLIKIFRTINI